MRSIVVWCSLLSLLISFTSAASLLGDYVRTPAGLVHRSCVHSAASGSRLSRTPQGTLQSASPHTGLVTEYARCQYPYRHQLASPLLPQQLAPSSASRRLLQFPPDYDGWLTYTMFNTTDFDSFLGYFSVPAKPKQTPDILYIFPALQNVDWIPIVDPEVPGFEIIQPVLQYPSDSSKSSWSMKSWYVTVDSGVIESDEILLDVGDVIFGNMSRITFDSNKSSGAESTIWYVGATSKLKSQTTDFMVDNARLLKQPFAYNTIECYGCSSCDNLPHNSPSDFTKLQLFAGGKEIIPTWLDTPKPPVKKVCDARVKIAAPNHVTFYFN